MKKSIDAPYESKINTAAEEHACLIRKYTF